MIDFDTYKICESVHLAFDDKITHQEELALAREFNNKFGRGFIDSISVNAGKDEDGNDVKITFSDTAHLKARFMQRYPDMTSKDIKRLIKTIGLGAYRTKPEYFYTGHKESILVFSKSKDIGIYVIYDKTSGSNLNFRLVTILPKGRSDISRTSDIKMIVEQYDLAGIVEKVVYIDETSFFDCEIDD